MPLQGWKKTGVLLVNLGSPEAPTTPAVRRYLREFLWDPRVVEAPRVLWWLILNLVILTTRPRRSAALYRKIWTDEGSPLITLSGRLAERVESCLRREVGTDVPVVLGMRYGRPSVDEALDRLRREDCERLVCIPLYPQYSGTTSGSVFDAVADALKSWRRVPDLLMIQDYCDDDGYIDALAKSVRRVWENEGESDRLLLSFHSLPCRYVEAGDPYVEQCTRTARALRARLDLNEERAPVAFQSKVGREPWVGPATDATVVRLAEAGVERLDVLCPGFAVDCLETIEEIGDEARTVFERHGGRRLRLIPCLNDDPAHAEALAGLIASQLGNQPSFTKR